MHRAECGRTAADPTTRRVAGISQTYLCRQPEAGQGASQIPEAPGVVVQRHDLDSTGTAFEDVPGLSSRGRACVEHPTRARGVEKHRGELSRLVLNGDQPFVEARNGLDGAR